MAKQPIEEMLDAVEWEVLPPITDGDSSLPYATHAGVLELFGQRLRCYRLSDGRAIFDAGDFHRFFNVE